MSGIRFVAGAPGTAKWLHLAAAPTFAMMALLTGLNGNPMNGVCAAGHAAALSGMPAMYLLMSMFHLPPWLAPIRCLTARITVT